MTETRADSVPNHILRELGYAVRQADGGIEGSAVVRPEMRVPGTDRLRTSVLAVWTDLMAGLLAAHSLDGRVPVTLELDIHLYRPAPSSGTVRGRGRPVKKGRTVFVASVEFAEDNDETFAFGSASFMAVPDPDLRLPEGLRLDLPPPTQTLTVPLAERAGCVRTAAGEATLVRSEDGLNSSNTVNGGLIALSVEEAALSRSPGRTLSVLDVRYLQPVRVGPAVATAQTRGGVSQVEVRDRGAHDRVAAIATTRVFDD